MTVMLYAFPLQYKMSLNQLKEFNKTITRHVWTIFCHVLCWKYKRYCVYSLDTFCCILTGDWIQGYKNQNHRDYGYILKTRKTDYFLILYSSLMKLIRASLTKRKHQYTHLERKGMSCYLARHCIVSYLCCWKYTCNL